MRAIAIGFVMKMYISRILRGFFDDLRLDTLQSAFVENDRQRSFPYLLLYPDIGIIKILRDEP
jgi:hypothetical protein